MCKRIRKSKEVSEVWTGEFMKNNEPRPLVMDIFLAPCACGEKVYGRIEGGKEWVEILSCCP